MKRNSKARLVEQLSDYYSLEGDELSQVTEALKNQVLNQDCKYDLLIAARDFAYRFADGRKFHFDSCELPDGKEYAYHFLWCLYAIVWGIQKFDADARLTAKEPGVGAVHGGLGLGRQGEEWSARMARLVQARLGRLGLAWRLILGCESMADKKTKEKLPSGRFLQRIPPKLHARLIKRAKDDRISLNTFGGDDPGQGCMIHAVD